jgi:Effector protein
VRHAKIPLNPDAVKAADEALYRNHPELNGRKLTMAPTDEESKLRKEWMVSYLAAGGQAKAPDPAAASTPPAPASPPATPTVPCPHATPSPPPTPPTPPTPPKPEPPDPGQEEYCKNLTIKGSKEFREKARKDLDELKKTKTGKEILDAIANGRHPVTVAELDKATAQANGGICTPDDEAAAADPKKGTGSTVTYSPEWSADQYTDQNGKKVDHPSKAYLGHELIHAVHMSEGTDASATADPKEPGSNQEESKTIGINDHAGDDMTENNLLKDLGYDYKRTDHDMSAHSGK